MPEQSEPRSAMSMLAESFAPMVVQAAFTPPLLARKVSMVIPMTPELLAEQQEMSEAQALMLRLLDGTATPEERSMAEQRRAVWEADRKKQRAAAVAEWKQVRERYADSPAVLAVLDIHQPEPRGGLECAHPVFGFESDAEDWPCSTYEAIKGAVKP